MRPGRSSAGCDRLRSTIVDSIPISAEPPSRIQGTDSPRSARTCSAAVGLTRPNRLAEGAATPLPPSASKASSKACATGCEGQRKPIESWPPQAYDGASAKRGRIRVRGPGQNASASRCAWGLHCAHSSALDEPDRCTIRGWFGGRPLIR